MPLLIAIEPDSRQAELIGEQVRGPLGAELIITDSVRAAIKAIEKRAPDLILTSLLLSPRDEHALHQHLRKLDAEGTRIQTLVIPMLAESAVEASPATGVLARLRKLTAGTAPPSPEGCAPDVFGKQIAEYLARNRSKRRIDEFDLVETADEVFQASDREWRPAPLLGEIDEFDVEALLGVVEQVTQRRHGEGSGLR
jgi:hypothetical protein